MNAQLLIWFIVAWYYIQRYKTGKRVIGFIGTYNSHRFWTEQRISTNRKSMFLHI